MRVWVDADACPGSVKEVLFRAAERVGVETVLVANHFVNIPRSRYIRVVHVSAGFDIADDRIAGSVDSGDLVVTGDIPLAAKVIERGAVALNPRGTLYTKDNVKDHLARRDLMDELRSTGMITGGPSSLSKTHIQAFANQLDKYLAQNAGRSPASKGPPGRV